MSSGWHDDAQAERSSSGEYVPMDRTERALDMVSQALRHMAERDAARDRGTRPGKMSDFKRLGPTCFTGKEGPVAAEEWLNYTEALLRTAHLPESRWIDILPVQLTSSAAGWWKAAEARLPQPITWETFRQAFLDTYFPLAERRNMVRAFTELKQGTRTVSEYVEEFQRLERYAPSLVPDETERMLRFREGLNLKLRSYVECKESPTLLAAVEAAKEKERVQAEKMASKTSGGKRGVETSSKYWGKRKKGASSFQTAAPTVSATQTVASVASPTVGRTSATQGRSTVTCHHCGRMGHMRKDCWKLHGRCFACGEPGHMANVCPKKKGSTSAGAVVSTQPPQTSYSKGKGQSKGQLSKAKVHALTAKDVLPEAKAVSGNLETGSTPSG